MSTRIQNRYGTSFEVSFPDFPTFKQSPQSVRLIQEQGKQDVIEIAYSSFDKHFQNALKTGVPFRLTWRTSFGKNEWVGYVYSGEDVTQSTMKRNVIIRGVGSAFVLKEGGTKIWKNKTAPEIVQDICKQNNIKAVVGTSAVRFSMQSLVGTTKWEKIQELAERIGFHAYVENTTLYFQKVDKLIDQFNSVVPIMSYNDGSVNAGVVFEAQTLDHFTAKIGDLSETGLHDKKIKTIQGVDPVTGRSHIQSSNPVAVGRNLRTNVPQPLFNQVMPSVVAETGGLAKELADGMAQLSRFSMHAIGKGQGDPRIAPYRTVQIQGTGSNTDGFWIVKKVEHYLTYDGRYTVDFTCMTDGLGKNKETKFRKTSSTVIPTRNVAYELATLGQEVSSIPTLRSRQPMIKQTNGGFKSTPTRWVGK